MVHNIPMRIAPELAEIIERIKEQEVQRGNKTISNVSASSILARRIELAGGLKE